MAALLLVDDDQILLEALSQRLRWRLPGVEVETCLSGSEARLTACVRRITTR
ncbi:hypothetical protein [Candidatus Nitrospira bockiana]